MHAIMGLGNPGAEYESTRHNLGFLVIDALSSLLDVRLSPGRGAYLAARRSASGRVLLLVKPLTYMNNSGIAVADILDRHSVELANLLVVCDDFQLPLGDLRARRGGSDGGHNGLYSIIEHLRSEDFPRLRCGIKSETMPKNKWEMADFVLSPFGRSEESVVQEMIERAREAAVCFATDGLTSLMNRFNSPHVRGHAKKTS